MRGTEFRVTPTGNCFLTVLAAVCPFFLRFLSKVQEYLGQPIISVWPVSKVFLPAQG